MSKFKGVLIASDLDGTLLSSDHLTVSKENLEAIAYFRKNGGTFTVATGRPPLSAKELLKGLNFDVPVVLLNGAIIYDMEKDAVLVGNNLPVEALDFSLDLINNFNEVGCEIFTADDLLLTNYSYVSEKHFANIGRSCEILSFENIPTPDKWFKVNFTHDDPAYLAKLEDYFKTKYGEIYQSCYSCKEFFEVTHLQARKDIGIFKVADKLGYSRDHIYTIGDNFNDYAMIKNAKYGFAPSNAEDEVKAVAHKVLSSCDESAVAEMIWYLDTIY